MIELRGRRRTDKMHWNRLDRRQQLAVTRRIAAIDGLHLIAIGSPLLVRRQERGRALCLTALIRELHGYGIEELIMESRDPTLNARDVATAQAARLVLPPDAGFRISHHLGAVEPLCWVADIVAGVVRAYRIGNPIYRDLLAERLYEFNVQC